MLIYWLLFAYPALLAVVYPVTDRRDVISANQSVAFLGFIVFYVAIAALRFETGGDWATYVEMYDLIDGGTLGEAFSITDPLFALLDWISAELGAGVYLVNAICAFILGYGTVRVALNFRDPWLAVTMSVPYLLIVVGLGYVRQGAAIGMVLIAIASFNRARPLRTALFLVGAILLHSTAVITVPLFVYAMVSRYKLAALVVSVIGAVAFYQILIPRLGVFEAGYIDAEYESSGALTRLLMSVIPSVLILLRWRHIAPGERVRPVWISMAAANLVALVALYLSPSSTAVDRIALFFAPIQMAMFGAFRDVLPVPRAGVIPTRLLLIGVAAAVQVVWLVYATHAQYWVPYKSVLDFL